MGKKRLEEQTENRDSIHDEILELFGERNKMPVGYRKNFSPASESDLGIDPEGNPINVYKPDNPEERYQ